MEKSECFVKRQMSSNKTDEEINVESIINSKIFRPKTVANSLLPEEIKKMVDYLKKQSVITEIMNNMNTKETKDKIITVSNELILQMESYNEKLKTSRENMYFNQEKFRRKNSKIDIKLLSEIIQNIETKERNTDDIKDIYNQNTNKGKVSLSTIRNNMTKNLHYLSKTPVLKDERYFDKYTIPKQVVFLYRLVKDLEANSEFFYYDESGINYKSNRRLIWVRSQESRKIKMEKKFQKMNVLMISSFQKIHEYSISVDSTDTEVVKEFLYGFLEKIGNERLKNIVLILDNHSTHRNIDMLNYISYKIKRIIFIPEYFPEGNQIELVFNVLKKNIKSMEEVTCKSFY